MKLCGSGTGSRLFHNRPDILIYLDMQHACNRKHNVYKYSLKNPLHICGQCYINEQNISFPSDFFMDFQVFHLEANR